MAQELCPSLVLAPKAAFNIVLPLSDRWQSRTFGLTVWGGGRKTESMNAYTKGTPRLQHDIIVIPIGGTQPAFLSLIIYAEKPSEASIGHLLQAKLSLSAIKML